MVNQLKKILDCSSSGVLFLTAKNTIEYANPSFYKMFGFNENQLTDTPIANLLHPDDLEKQLQESMRLLNSEIKTYQIEQRMLRADKSTIWVHESVQAIQDDDGDVSNQLMICTDITKYKGNEESLANFASVAAHDLKSPLASIQTFSDLFLRKAECSSKYTSYIESIKNICIDTQMIINDLLETAKSESSAHILEKEIFDINEFIRGIIPVYLVLSEKKGIVLTEYTAKEPYLIHANKKAIQRVIENLLTNAIKYTETTGSIIISTITTSKQVMLTIIDSGIGIPDDFKPNLFQKFARGNKKGTYGEPSTGLGLFIVKKLLDLHNASIEISSKENLGTTVVVNFKREFQPLDELASLSN
jgi:two-component system, OmpR family, sensor histidine kinase VicK